MAYNWDFEGANVSYEDFAPKGEVYNVDIAMCIDATGSMSALLDTVKNNALSFYRDVMEGMDRKGKTIDQLRVRVIVFRDYISDGANAMLVTDFYTLPAENEEFSSLVHEVKAFGGGDRPEDGLEALAYAMRSDWTRGGSKRRHIIVVWTDDATHPLGFGKKAKQYPSGMPKDFDELSEWWGDEKESGLMDNNAKRLLVFAPKERYWTTIESSWNNALVFYSKAGQGLEELDYREILDAIYNSI